jgi:hypothetical protein
MSGDDQSTRDLMKELDQEAVNLEASDALEQAHIDQERAEQAELEQAADENASVREQEALDQANRELMESTEREQAGLDEAPVVEETSAEPEQSSLDASDSQSTRDLMQELDQEAVNLEASDALEQAHIDQERREQRELEDAANDNSQAIADEEQARLDEANRELMEATRDEALGIDQEASAELERLHLEQEARDAAAPEHAGEVAGDQSPVAIERAGTTPTNVVQNVVIGVIAIATLIAGAALMRNRTRTPRPSGVLRASIDVEYIHKYDWLDHRIKFNSTTEIGENVGGTGEGEYRERGDSTPEGEEPCSVIRSGHVTMRVEITPSLRELAAKIQGPVERRVTGRPDCGANVDQLDRADIVCVFQNVDFVRGGRYRAEDHPPEIWDGNINQETCTMDLTPLGK